MLAGGELVGVLHVGSQLPAAFTEEDVRLLQLAAERASVAAQTRVNRIDRSAALALQRSLLPTRLPGADGVDMAARYVPVTTPASAATGTTCSTCPPAGSGSSSATCPVTGSTRPW
jgi:signal transduction protein with GAF and PtsI domain